MTNGTIQLNDIRIKQSGDSETVCNACSLVSKVDGPVWDTALWRAASGVMLVTAEDSGRLTLVDPRMTAQPLVLATGVRQSALKLSVDSITHSGQQKVALSAGFDSSIAVYDLAQLSA